MQPPQWGRQERQTERETESAESGSEHKTVQRFASCSQREEWCFFFLHGRTTFRHTGTSGFSVFFPAFWAFVRSIYRCFPVAISPSRTTYVLSGPNRSQVDGTVSQHIYLVAHSVSDELLEHWLEVIRRVLPVFATDYNPAQQYVYLLHCSWAAFVVLCLLNPLFCFHSR